MFEHLFNSLMCDILTGQEWLNLCMFVCFVYTDCAEKLFDLVDSFAESAKRKAAVWPLQIILLILCPEITQSITKEVGGEEKANKVRDHNDNSVSSLIYRCVRQVSLLFVVAHKNERLRKTPDKRNEALESLVKPRHCWSL